MIDYNHRSSASESILSRIDQSIEWRAEQEPPRDYLGASVLGDACDRRLQYQYLNVSVDLDRAFDAKTLRVFQRGHVMEEMGAIWLRDAGFEVVTENSDGEQIGFTAAGGRIRGHVDGVIVSGPDEHAYPMLWENKALGNRSWKALAKGALALAKPIYAAQVAIYQAYLELHLNPALFTAINADTMELYVELVPFNGELAQRASDRGVRILQACEAHELLPRLANDPTHYECKFCPWQDRCWGGGA
jgi:hypothetical protein